MRRLVGIVLCVILFFALVSSLRSAQQPQPRLPITRSEQQAISAGQQAQQQAQQSLNALTSGPPPSEVAGSYGKANDPTGSCVGGCLAPTGP